MAMERPREQGRDEAEAGRTTSPVNSSAERAGLGAGLRLARHFVAAGVNPYDEVDWDVRSAVIQGEGGETVFEQRDVEVPRPWSQLATNVVVSKYFPRPRGTPQRARSRRQLDGQRGSTIGEWGGAQGYFAEPADRE